MLLRRIGLKRAVLLLALFVVLQQCNSFATGMSIETSDSTQTRPVKVTHKNSGPSYEIDLRNELDSSSSNSDNVEKRKVGETNENEQPGSGALAQSAPSSKPLPSSGSDEETLAPVGHVTIRRIFLIPTWQHQSSDAENSPEIEPDRLRSRMIPPSSSFGMRPFWPFMAPPAPLVPSESVERPHQHHAHLFGSDEASRSPTRDIGSDRNEREPMFDPIRMMLDMMQQAINERLRPVTGSNETAEPENERRQTNNSEADLNKEATSGLDNNNNDNNNSNNSKPISVERRPQSSNETKVEVVEIDGKKYLKKTLVSKHVGENLIFMTRRLVFVPVNETDSTSNIGTTTITSEPKSGSEPTTTTTTTTTVSSSENSATPTSAPIDSSSTGTSSSTSTTSEQPNKDWAKETPREMEETTTNGSAQNIGKALVDRVSEAFNKAERLVEKAKESLSSQTSTSTTTEKPATAA